MFISGSLIKGLVQPGQIQDRKFATEKRLYCIRLDQIIYKDMLMPGYLNAKLCAMHILPPNLKYNRASFLADEMNSTPYNFHIMVV